MQRLKCLLLSFCACLCALTGFAQLGGDTNVKWSAKTVMETAATGNIIVSAKVNQGYHFYSFDGNEYNPLRMAVKPLEGIKLLGSPVASIEPESHYEEVFKETLKWWARDVDFTIPFEITDKKNHEISIEVEWQTCNDDSCFPPTKKTLKVEAEYATPGLPAAPAAKAAAPETAAVAAESPAATTPEEPTVEEEVAETPAELPDSTTVASVASVSTDNSMWWEPVETKAASTESNSPWRILLIGFLGGLAALVTPCVWPLIPMTISFFLKKTGTRRDANGKKIQKKFVFSKDAILYGASIVVIYLFLGIAITMIFGAGKLNELSTNAVFNIIFFAILVIFAISFFGAFDIKLPEKWSNAMDSKAEATTGIISIFFMAFTLVIVSFSCTGPIIGTLLVEAASQGKIFGPALGMGGFALGLAIPFSIFAMFPTLLKEMPKSGGWLNSVKVVLGFIELILALKFLSVADMAYGWRILDREVFIALWIVLFLLFGMYLLGKLTFAHDDKIEKLSVTRFMLALLPLSFAVYLLPGLWGAPLKAVSAFLPHVKTQDFNLYVHDNNYQEFDDYEEAMKFAAAEGKPVLIDFSGYGCVNCRNMEVEVFDKEEVRAKVAEDFVFVQLMVDDRSPLREPFTVVENGETRTLTTAGEKWTYLQSHKFGENSQPSYIILDNEGRPMSEPVHYDNSVERFLNFLDNGLETYKKTK